MQIGCHGSVWSGTFDREGLRSAVSKTRQAGFDLIEIPLMDPYGLDIPATREALAEHELAATASIGLKPELDLSSEDPEIVKAGEGFVGRCLEVVSELGGTHLVGVIYCAMTKYQAPASATGRRNSVEAIRRLGARGEQLGVQLGIEVVNRYESNLINTAQQGLDYLDEVGSDNVTLHLDTYHMNIEERDLYSPLVTAGSRLGYAHVGESHRGYLGSGTVHFDSFFRGLDSVGYDGPVVFESFSSAIVHEDLSNMLAIWRNLWTDSDDLGTHANSFIRNQLRSVPSVQARS
jgi:D-psicose/D-tagatose/L-ribulose 3-epimerase